MRSLKNASIEARSIKNYDFQIFKSKIRPKLMCLFRVYFLTTLEIYKAYFKSRHIQLQNQEAIAFITSLDYFVR